MLDTEPRRLTGDGFMFWLVPAMFLHKTLIEPVIARWRGWRFR